MIEPLVSYQILGECGTYQRSYVAMPNSSTTHQSTRTLRIHIL